jgi:hypothetical protein
MRRLPEEVVDGSRHPPEPDHPNLEGSIAGSVCWSDTVIMVSEG